MRSHSFAISMLSCLAALTACSGPDSPIKQNPVVAITYPQPNDLLSTKRVTVKGTAQYTDEVMVNGKPSSVVGGVWSSNVAFEEGEAVATVEVRGVSDEVTFRIDASAPKLAVTSPARASFIPATQTSARVQGSVEDTSSGLSLLKVNEQIVTVAGDGTFTYDAPLVEGLNTLDITAIDLAGNTSQTLIGVVHGTFEDPTARVDPGIDFTLDRSVFDKITQVISALITPEQVSTLLAENLGADSQVMLSEISFDPVQIDAIPRSNTAQPREPGFVDFKVTVKNVTLKGAFALSSDDIELDVMLSQAAVTTSMTLTANEEGGLDIAFSQPRLEIEDGALTWAVRSGGSELGNEDSNLLSNIVDSVVELAFSEILSEQVIEQLYDPALLNRRVTLLGRTLEFQLRLEEIITNASGIFVSTTFSMPAQAYPEIPDAPGALAIAAGPTSNPGIARDALIGVNANAINRLLHGVWRSGLMNQSLKGQDFAGFELPLELEAGALALAIDGRITNFADNSSPAGLALKPQLPPIISLRSAEDDSSSALLAQLGEFHMELLLDTDSSSPTRLATFALFMDLSVELDINERNQISIKLDFNGRTDLIDEPLFDLDDTQVEELMQGIFALIPTLLANELTLNGEADIQWLKFKDPEVVVHGLEKDQLSFGLNFEADPSAISLSPSE